MEKIRFKKLDAKAIAPAKAHNTDAGFDLTATSRKYEGGCWVYGTGIATEIPVGYVGLLFPRSSICRTGLTLSNSVGVIDSGYRGEITFKFRAAKEHPVLYNIGDRVGQLIIMPFPAIEFEEVDELSASERGTGGYGSTGK